jgi:NAD(P)-dependent dehydrogenase (short-subunit alcohol dehydrogenase family)
LEKPKQGKAKPLFVGRTLPGKRCVSGDRKDNESEGERYEHRNQNNLDHRREPRRRALVDEALRRHAKKVYAGTRGDALQNADDRVTPVTIDVTSAEQIQGAVENVESLDILINNAGLALYDDLSDRAALEQSLAVNLYGPGVTQAFLPLLTRSRGAIVNVLSLAAIAAVPFSPAYSISKAAAFSLAQSLRALLARQGVSVHVVLPGPVDTDMSRGLDIPKASPESVARGIFDGIEKGEEDIFPDAMSASRIAPPTASSVRL